MNRSHRILSSTLVATTMLLLSCSATYNVARVIPADATTSHPGVYYMLPKTQIVVVLTLHKKTAKQPAFPQPAWDACSVECPSPTASDEPDKCVATVPKETSTYDVVAAKVYSRSLPDSAHLYRANVDFGTFAAFSHTFKLTDQGVLSSSSSELENQFVQIAIDTTKAIANVIGGAVSQPAPNDVAQGTARATKKKPVGCHNFETWSQRQGELDQKSEAVKAELDALLVKSPDLDPAAIQLLKNRSDERLRALGNLLKFRELTEARQGTEKDESIGDYAVIVEPGNGPSQEFHDWKPIQSYATNGIADLQATPAEQSEVIGAIGYLKAQEARVLIVREIQFGVDCDATACKPTAGSTKEADQGFRYRVPSAALVEIQMLEKKTSSFEIIGSTRMPVAQFGALVSLPSKISGLKAKVALEMYDGLGAAKQIDVGATPQAPTLVGDLLSPIQQEIDRRNKAKADAAAAAAGAEFADLTKQRDLLKLKKEIKDLNESLNEKTGP